MHSRPAVSGRDVAGTDYEDLERDDLLAALAYAARVSDAKRVALVE
ncbi:MAG: hypothetical protein WA183_05795 [Chthoniobacterales bacterium]